jgi:hypothetical protein
MPEDAMNNIVPPGYKKTEVGVIPEEWEVACFDTFGSVIDGDRGLITRMEAISNLAAIVCS